MFFSTFWEKTPEETLQALEDRIKKHFENDTIKIIKTEDAQYENGIGRWITYENLTNNPPKEEVADLFYVPDSS